MPTYWPSRSPARKIKGRLLTIPMSHYKWNKMIPSVSSSSSRLNFGGPLVGPVPPVPRVPRPVVAMKAQTSAKQCFFLSSTVTLYCDCRGPSLLRCSKMWSFSARVVWFVAARETAMAVE